MKKTPWTVVITPTKDGRGYRMDLISNPESRPKLETLAERIGEVLGEVSLQSA